MKFVKSTERLPEMDKPVCLQWKGEPCSGSFQKHYDRIECYIHNRGTYLEASFIYIEWLDMDEQDEGWVPVAKRLVELRPLHIAPYNLGDMGEIDELIHKLAKMLPATKD